MSFQNAHFIKPDVVFDPTYRRRNPAPLFRKSLTLIQKPSSATLSICGLGYAYCFINGKRISPDLFCAPVSDYRKTLWYVTYEVAELLQAGENVISVICGNGWYNEEFRSSWNHNEAQWRDLPKFILELSADDISLAVSDGSWKCMPETAVVFNALRSGETFDARLCDDRMLNIGYDDSAWSYAVIDQAPPRGVFRKCDCEPIREHEIYSPTRVIQTADNRFVFDIGQNISGYIRLTASGKAGQEITVRYAELLTEENTRELNHMFKFYPESDIQTDRFICSGKPFTWSPMFTYHGFRYIELEGIASPDEVDVKAVFVHQDVKRRTTFDCSDPTLNALFHAGQISSLSNMFYLISDCPTREKMGWMNDIHMTCEQFCTDFKCERLLRKWLTDIHDAQREDGALPGIVPTPAWGYDWGNGPLSDGALFEISYRLWLHSGDNSVLTDSIPYFARYLDYLKSHEDKDGHITEIGLDDWAPPHKESVIPLAFVNDILRIKFLRIYALALQLSGADHVNEDAEINARVLRARRDYLNLDGSSKLNELTAIAMQTVEQIGADPKPLAAQLQARFEDLQYHHNCGMLGMGYLFRAFNACGLEEYAMRLLTEQGFPGYRHWLDAGATTLWEKWFLDNQAGSNSRNHHMYSSFMPWLISTVLGIRHDRTDPERPAFTVAPCFFERLQYAHGSYTDIDGTLTVDWKKHDADRIELNITLTGNACALYKDTVLRAGAHSFQIQK